MNSHKSIILSAFFLLIMFVNCGEEVLKYDDPTELQADGFTFIPENPLPGHDISMVYYGCGYYQTSSVSTNKNRILVVKKFNGSMKRPCILELDTIALGNLKKGEYLVTLKIIDINPFAQDSLFSSETKKLIVGH